MTTMTTKHTPATPLTPHQQFYSTLAPTDAIGLALADSFAYCAPMMPDSDYVKALRKAKERVDAYPRLVHDTRESQVALTIALAALRKAGMETEAAAVLEAVNAQSALLRELGESE